MQCATYPQRICFSIGCFAKRLLLRPFCLLHIMHEFGHLPSVLNTEHEIGYPSYLFLQSKPAMWSGMSLPLSEHPRKTVFHFVSQSTAHNSVKRRSFLIKNVDPLNFYSWRTAYTPTKWHSVLWIKFRRKYNKNPHINSNPSN